MRLVSKITPAAALALPPALAWLATGDALVTGVAAGLVATAALAYLFMLLSFRTAEKRARV
jgi:hypothetical protein